MPNGDLDKQLEEYKKLQARIKKALEAKKEYQNKVISISQDWVSQNRVAKKRGASEAFWKQYGKEHGQSQGSAGYTCIGASCELIEKAGIKFKTPVAGHGDYFDYLTSKDSQMVLTDVNSIQVGDLLHHNKPRNVEKAKELYDVLRRRGMIDSNVDKNKFTYNDKYRDELLSSYYTSRNRIDKVDKLLYAIETGGRNKSLPEHSQVVYDVRPGVWKVKGDLTGKGYTEEDAPRGAYYDPDDMLVVVADEGGENGYYFRGYSLASLNEGRPLGEVQVTTPAVMGGERYYDLLNEREKMLSNNSELSKLVENYSGFDPEEYDKNMASYDAQRLIQATNYDSPFKQKFAKGLNDATYDGMRYYNHSQDEMDVIKQIAFGLAGKESAYGMTGTDQEVSEVLGQPTEWLRKQKYYGGQNIGGYGPVSRTISNINPLLKNAARDVKEFANFMTTGEPFNTKGDIPEYLERSAGEGGIDRSAYRSFREEASLGPTQLKQTDALSKVRHNARDLGNPEKAGRATLFNLSEQLMRMKKDPYFNNPDGSINKDRLYYSLIKSHSMPNFWNKSTPELADRAGMPAWIKQDPEGAGRLALRAYTDAYDFDYSNNVLDYGSNSSIIKGDSTYTTDFDLLKMRKDVKQEEKANNKAREKENLQKAYKEEVEQRSGYTLPPEQPSKEVEFPAQVMPAESTRHQMNAPLMYDNATLQQAIMQKEAEKSSPMQQAFQERNQVQFKYGGELMQTPIWSIYQAQYLKKGPGRPRKTDNSYNFKPFRFPGYGK